MKNTPSRSPDQIQGYPAKEILENIEGNKNSKKIKANIRLLRCYLFLTIYVACHMLSDTAKEPLSNVDNLATKII